MRGGSDGHHDSDASERAQGMATLLGAGDQENSNQDGRRPRLDAHGFVPFSWSKLQAAECHRKYLLDCLGESHCRVEFRASEVDKTVCCNACNRAMEVTWVPTIQPLVAKEKTPPESTIAGAVLHFVREWAAEEAMRVVHGDDLVFDLPGVVQIPVETQNKLAYCVYIPTRTCLLSRPRTSQLLWILSEIDLGDTDLPDRFKDFIVANTTRIREACEKINWGKRSRRRVGVQECHRQPVSTQPFNDSLHLNKSREYHKWIRTAWRLSS